MTNPDVQAPAPVESPTGDDGPADPVAGAGVDPGAGPGDGRPGDGSSPTQRASVAESLADIRADRIIADARREAQAIVDAARVEARREARAIVDGARAEAETIITEAFEQRARIVRRDWAIGDGDSPWSRSGGSDDDGNGGDDHSDVAGTFATGADDEPVTPPQGVVLPDPLSDVAVATAIAVPIESAPPADAEFAAEPEAERFEPEPPEPEDVPRRVPAVDPAAALADLIDSPVLRARERMGRLPALPEPAQGPRPPLPSRLRRAQAQPSAPRALRMPAPPPPPPAPVPPPPSQRNRPRPRPRVERELPAGMRIPPDVPDWDDDYADAEDR